MGDFSVVFVLGGLIFGIAGRSKAVNYDWEHKKEKPLFVHHFRDGVGRFIQNLKKSDFFNEILPQFNKQQVKESG